MAKAADRIKALLAKAISTTFENERETFAAKGLKLAIKYHNVKKFYDMLSKAGISDEILSEALANEAVSGPEQGQDEKQAEDLAAFERDPQMVWRPLDGRILRIGQMETMHLINVKNYLTRIGKEGTYVYRNIDAEIRSRGPEFPWKPRHIKRKSK